MSENDLHLRLVELAELAPVTLERRIGAGRIWPFTVAAAAIVLVVGGTAALLERPAGHRDTVIADVSTTATPTMTPTKTPAGPPTKAEAESACDHGIGELIVPDDAVEQTTPPGSELAQPTTIPSGDLVTRTRFWVTHLSLDDALAYLNQPHPGGDRQPFGGSSTNTLHGKVQTKSLLEGLYGQAQVQFTLQPLADGRTGIRGDAQCTYGDTAITVGPAQGPGGDVGSTTGGTAGGGPGTSTSG